MKVLAPNQYAKAFSAAFVADIERAPSIKTALRDRRLDGQGLANMALRDIRSRNPRLFPNVRAMVKKLAEQEIAPPLTQYGMAQWAELATALVTTAATVGAKVYTAKLETQAAESVQKLQLQQQQAAAAAAELQAKTARLQYSQAEAAAARSEAAGTPQVLGVPWWAAALGLVTVGTVGYLALRGKGRR